MKFSSKAAVVLVCVFCAAGSLVAQVVYTPYDDAKPVLESMREILPIELRNATGDAQRVAWNDWVKKRDADIRSRLSQGDADTIVNFLVFGTSFTTAPRLTSDQLQSLSQSSSQNTSEAANVRWQMLFAQRLRDLVQGIALPNNNERLLFAGAVLAHAGITPGLPDYEHRAGQFLLENVKRVLKEQTSFQQTLAEAQSLNDPTEEFAERSKLYKERGLSLDTSLPPDYALEVALKEMKSRGLLKTGSVKRVGIIGPGLDFTDKQEGFDFYPTQTVQPFAVMDSLLRLGLTNANEIEVDTLDLSPRILAHVQRSAHAASQGRGYTIQLPRDPSRGWNTELTNYWKHFGDQIGSPAAPVAVPPALKGVLLRAVRVRPEFVRRMKTYDANIVLQRSTLRDSEKYDLLIATNILVYYDTFEQTIAMTNIAAILRPGGALLTNNLLLELPASPLHAGDYVSVPYSPKDSDGDRIVWYEAVAAPR